MSQKQMLRRRIWEIDFVLYELVLFLDSHPDCQRALALMRDYRRLRRETLKDYEERYGAMPITARDVEPEGMWEWINGPWPWENDFAKGDN